MYNLTLPPGLAEQIAELYFAQSDRIRRDRNRKRTGKVVEIKADEGKARVQLNEGKGGYAPMKTGWIPWNEQAMGANRSHMPPSVGQQVEVTSENGDLTDAVITNSLPSNDVPRPSQAADEYVLSQVGGTKVRTKGDSALVESERVDLGGEGGKRVARVGDMVHVQIGSSAGFWPIVEGSEKVFAVD